MSRKREIEQMVEELENDPANNPFVEGVREQAAEWETGGIVLEEGERELLDEAGFEVHPIEHRDFSDLDLVSLSEAARAYIEGLREPLDLKAVRDALEANRES